MKNKVWIIVILLVLVSTVLMLNNSFSNKSISENEVVMNYKNTIKEVSSDYYDGMWKYKNDVKKIIFEDNNKEIDNYIEKFDISVDSDNSVIAYVVNEDEDIVIYIKSDGKIIANKNSSNLFSRFDELIEIDNIELLDTSNVENMSYMFANCSSLTYLDLSSFDTKKVTNMAAMFADCISLSILNIDNFKTDNVIDMTKMFYDCISITDLDLSSWNTSNVVIMRKMFEYCSSLKKINISNWNTEKLTDISFMFDNCDSLEEIDLNNWNTKSVIDMRGTFANCSNLKVIKNNFDMSNVKYIGYNEKTDILTYQNYGMFFNSPNVNVVLNINNVIDDYQYAFTNDDVNSNAQFIINYSSSTEKMIDEIIATNNHVYKGKNNYDAE